jgi:hypothetical protein
MIIDMSLTGERFAMFMRKKRYKMRKGTSDAENYHDTASAAFLNLPYKTVNRWLKQESVDRIDIDNFMALLHKYGQEFIDYREQGGTERGMGMTPFVVTGAFIGIFSVAWYQWGLRKVSPIWARGCLAILLCFVMLFASGMVLVSIPGLGLQ